MPIVNPLKNFLNSLTIKNRGFVFSGAFHVIFIAFLIFGVPALRSPFDTIDSPIPVEVVPIGKKTQAPPIRKKKVFEKKPEKKPEPKPKPPPAPKQKPITKDVTPTPQQKPERPDTKPDPKPKPPQKEKKPEVKQPPKKPEEKPFLKQKQDDPFDSVIKAVEDLKKTEEPLTEEAKKKQINRAPEKGNTISISEIDALKQQLMRCWTPPVGVKGAETIAVNIHLIMSPEAKVLDAQIVDKSRYQTDTQYRVAGDAALRAVRHPSCSPLRLPAGKYASWHNFTLLFDPKHMF
ncbi:MAG: hypothetical protein HOI80_00185 [Alphaproteobacteria bacterium]|jgi:outer membrane biosynthesis protein TonB|nr:hypothetical protein [Alphaproteobacteria bacterium]MBT5389217.1 hypothetical protein [Alphaproteobacteria bacterium]MBT5653905.1 hypothetical protein [Alphaproteobacteria bacterium]